MCTAIWLLMICMYMFTTTWIFTHVAYWCLDTHKCGLFTDAHVPAFFSTWALLAASQYSLWLSASVSSGIMCWWLLLGTNFWQASSIWHWCCCTHLFHVTHSEFSILFAPLNLCHVFTFTFVTIVQFMVACISSNNVDIQKLVASVFLRTAIVFAHQISRLKLQQQYTDQRYQAQC